jgi:protein SCO1/2
MKNYSYIGISFIILVFGIWSVPKIVDKFTNKELSYILDANKDLKKIPDFSFINQDNRQITNESYKGKVYVVEFFFTNCPSICPIMNRNMVKIQDEFYGNLNLGMASFSIDPNTDTPEVLKQYATSYKITNPNWHLLTGDKENIYALANLGFNFVGEDSEFEEGFEHSGFFALIDQEGYIRCRIDENENPIIYYNGLDDDGIQMIKEDIKLLL